MPLALNAQSTYDVANGLTEAEQRALTARAEELAADAFDDQTHAVQQWLIDPPDCTAYDLARSFLLAACAAEAAPRDECCERRSVAFEQLRARFIEDNADDYRNRAHAELFERDEP